MEEKNMTTPSTKLTARQREPRTKELPLKYRVKTYIAENPDASKKEIADHFGISTKELSLVLAKIN